MRVLIIGDGLLGSELKKQNPNWVVLSRKEGELDITSFHWMSIIKDYDVVVNCIAHTDTYDKSKDKHWAVNYEWVDNLINGCNAHGVKLVHISTDYVYANSDSNANEESIPVHHKSWYGYTKLLSDGLVQLRAHNYLLIRCGHKPVPFPYESATNSIVGNFDYVDIIADLISMLVHKDTNGVVNAGTELKTMLELARRTKPYIQKTTGLPVASMPDNVTMDIAKIKSILPNHIWDI